VVKETIQIQNVTGNGGCERARLWKKQGGMLKGGKGKLPSHERGGEKEKEGNKARKRNFVQDPGNPHKFCNEKERSQEKQVISDPETKSTNCWSKVNHITVRTKKKSKKEWGENVV